MMKERMSCNVEFDEVNFKKAFTPPLVTLLSYRPRARKNSFSLAIHTSLVDDKIHSTLDISLIV